MAQNFLQRYSASEIDQMIKIFSPFFSSLSASKPSPKPISTVHDFWSDHEYWKLVPYPQQPNIFIHEKTQLLFQFFHSLPVVVGIANGEMTPELIQFVKDSKLLLKPSIQSSGTLQPISSKKRKRTEKMEKAQQYDLRTVVFRSKLRSSPFTHMW